MGIAGRQRKWGVAVEAPDFGSDHILFDSHWQPPDETPVGELEKPFDYADILRLRADAIREATGADLGIISAYTPGWRRWSTALPAGPVTLHDIATTDMFPEYVTLCEASGQSVTELLKRAATSTVLADQRDPAYDPKGSRLLSEIDAAKTYRLAMGYEDLPAFRVEPSKLPKVIAFRTPEEFLAIGHTALPVRSLNQIPLEATEAVARYIRKRGRAAPRPECFDLAAYIQNPETHSFGACDWLHLGADVTWKHPQSGKPLHYRYTLSLGLRAAADPDLAPPRGDSKSFLDLDLAAREGEAPAEPFRALGRGSAGASPSRFDFATLGRKLPVSVAAAARPLDVPNGKAILIDVRVANTGRQDVMASLALSPSAMQHIEGFTWPSQPDKTAPAAWYSGFRVAIGEYKKPTLHENAALLLFDGPAPRMAKLAARGAGYNFGLIGIHHSAVVKAGASLSVPLLLLAVDRPDPGPAIDLPAVLEDLRRARRVLGYGP